MFTDKASGKDTLRPALEVLLAFVRERSLSSKMSHFQF
jgi:hypothetical protein